jgi:polyphosphate kinase 2 (PPK2 family)
MFESAELGNSIDKATFQAEVPALRQDLLNAQFDLAQSARFQVIILLSGADGSGKREVVHTLMEWMDPRHIQTRAMGSPSEEERQRPEMWRFWRILPPRGKIGIFFHSWYSAPVLKRVLGQTTDADLDQSLDDIARFEKMLTAEGALLLKIRLHISKKKQEERLRKLEKNLKTRWRVTRMSGSISNCTTTSPFTHSGPSAGRAPPRRPGSSWRELTSVTAVSPSEKSSWRGCVRVS